MAALKKACGENSAITTRFEVDTLMGADGLQATDEGIRFVELLNAEGLCDLWSVKIGDYEEWGEDAGTSRFRKSGWMTPFVKQVKGVVGDTPVVVNGRLTSPDDMVRLINAGVADIIGAARPSIADPFLPKKIEEGRLDDIRECIGCNMCVSKFVQIGVLNCTQNATAMEEYRRGWHPEKFDQTENPCSVLVVGGGPAGMECARVLGERGYDVHLREAEAALGGHWKDVVRMPRLEEWARVITYREAQLAKLKTVEVHLGVGEMSADDVLSYGADKVVIATGARWLGDGLSPMGHVAIPGVDAAQPNCLTPTQVMAGKEVPGNHVFVLDAAGHFTAIALAEMMADQGKQVTYVTCMAEISEYGVFTLDVFNNKRMLQEKNIAHHRDTWVESLTASSITLFNIYRQGPDLHNPVTGQSPRNQSTKKMELPCDAIILVTSRASNDALYRELKARRGEWAGQDIQDVFRIGDCHAPRQALNAIFDGHRLAREFDSPHPQYPLPWIRERQVWQAETYPKLGDARVTVEP